MWGLQSPNSAGRKAPTQEQKKYPQSFGDSMDRGGKTEF